MSIEEVVRLLYKASEEAKRGNPEKVETLIQLALDECQKDD